MNEYELALFVGFPLTLAIIWISAYLIVKTAHMNDKKVTQ